MDSSGNLFAANLSYNTVVEFAKGANGNATPIATISGSSTGLVGPAQMAVAQGSVVQEADLAAALACPAHLTVGGTGTCALKVTNHGPDAAEHVTASVTLPARLAEVSCSTGCRRHGDRFTWTRFSLADGKTAKFTVTVKAVTAGQARVAGNTSSATTDPDLGNNHATAVITIKT